MLRKNPSIEFSFVKSTKYKYHRPLALQYMRMRSKKKSAPRKTLKGVQPENVWRSRKWLADRCSGIIG